MGLWLKVSLTFFVLQQGLPREISKHGDVCDE